MSLFASVKDFFRPPQPSETSRGFKIPYGLSEGEWEKLKTLTADEAWEIYLKVVDKLITLQGERFLQTSNVDASFVRGYVNGLRRASSIVDEISAQEKNFVRERQKRADSGARARGGRSFYGSPGWTGNGADRGASK